MTVLSMPLLSIVSFKVSHFLIVMLSVNVQIAVVVSVNLLTVMAPYECY
jgi:hypothetical protein